MKILVLSKYSRKGASSRFRFFQYFQGLQEAGVELKTEPLFNDDYLVRLYSKKSRLWSVVRSYFRRLIVIVISAGEYDLIWLEKECFPWVPWFVEKWFLRLLRTPYVVDYDDAIFHQYDLHRFSIVRSLLSTKCDMVMKHSICCVGGNEYLVSRATQAGAGKVVKIPTVVSEKIYAPKEPKNQVPVIGWIGSMSTARYLEKLYPVLRELSKKYEFNFQVVGAKVDWSDVPFENIEWTEEQEIALIQKFDIGVMPLLDSPWERGKCGFKLIQYMACGKAVVADPVGVNADIVENQMSGILVSEQITWFQALATLLEDSSLRNNMGHSGYLRFKRRYSLECWQDYLMKLFQDCVNKK